MSSASSPSSRIAGYCQRIFGRTQLRQTVRPPYVSYSTYDPLFPGLAYREPDAIVLEAPGPIVTIDALTAQNAPAPFVEGTDFERDGFRLFRLFNDVRVVWAYRKIVIDFTVGYRLPGDGAMAGVDDLPASISAACGDLVARAWSASRRDATIGRETIIGVSQMDFSPFGATTAGGSKNGLPADIAAMLDPYVFRAVA
jgi:ABC-type amino acid transport substrate-binding protein